VLTFLRIKMSRMECKHVPALRRALLGSAAALLCLMTAAGLRGQEADLEGQRVVAIRIVDEWGQELRDKLPPLPLESGKPFRIEVERESLRRLYQTGRYSGIRVEAAPVSGGLRVDFVVRRSFYNNVVRIEGLHEPPTEAVAMSVLRLQLGETFREAALKEGLDRLKETLQEEGLYEARLDTVLTPHEDTRQMDIIVRVTQGPRARIGAIQFRNQTTYSDTELQHRSKLKSGGTLTSRGLERASERLRKYLVSAGYLSEHVALRRGDYDPSSKSVPLTYEVTAGSRVKVEVTGAKFRTKQLRKLLPIYAEGAVDEDLLLEGRRNLRDMLQREGYFDSSVSYTTSGDAKSGEQLIKYEISRGPRHRLIGVTFDGNQYFSSRLLRSRLFIQPSSFAFRGRFSPQIVKDDADLIRETYISNGFREAQVGSEVLDDHHGNTGDLHVRFHITEGPQTLVAELKLEGNHAFKDDELLAVIGSAVGQPFSDANISADRDNILALYYNDGYPGAHFESQAVETGTPNRVRLTYRIIEGSQVEVERVLLAGYQHTRPGTVAHQVRVKAGGPLREGDVIETQRRLYSLGIFTRVAVAPQNPTGTDEDKTVVVEVEEGSRYTFGYGFGFEVQRLAGEGGNNPTSSSLSASPRVILELTKANVGGRAQTLSFKVRASLLQYRGLVSYSIPDFFAHRHFSLLLTGFVDKTNDIQTFTSRRIEGSFQVNQTVSQSTTMLYRYFFRRVTVSNLQIEPEEIPLFSQPTLTSGFGVTFVRDRRDNPGDASRGSFNTFDVALAARSLGSSAGFLRAIFQDSTYHRIGRSLVFARSVRFGVEKTLPGTTAVDVPLPERFFAGGGASLRGLGLNQAGPRDPVTGFPIGGLALLVFNQELRFPMHLPFAGNHIGGAIFYDGGNVYSDFRHITFNRSPSLNNMNNLNYFSHTIGFGFRYATPVGPVRLDLGYQLNPPKFSFLNTTTNMVQVSQLPHFQFFFNIGSIF